MSTWRCIVAAPHSNRPHTCRHTRRGTSETIGAVPRVPRRLFVHEGVTAAPRSGAFTASTAPPRPRTPDSPESTRIRRPPAYKTVTAMYRPHQALLARGADPNAASRSGNTPLHIAALEGAAECVHALLRDEVRETRRGAQGSRLRHASEDMIDVPRCCATTARGRGAGRERQEDATAPRVRERVRSFRSLALNILIIRRSRSVDVRPRQSSLRPRRVVARAH